MDDLIKTSLKPNIEAYTSGTSEVAVVLPTIVPAPLQTTEKEENYIPLLHGNVNKHIAKSINKPLTVDVIANTATLLCENYKLVMDEINSVVGSLGVSTHKLFSVAVATFTANNHTGSGKDREVRSLSVTIPLDEYASKCGYDVTIHHKEGETDEEVKAEAQRAKRSLDNARRKINRDLSLLFKASLSWGETEKGKNKNYIDVRLITSKGVIKNKMICINFTPEIAQYLIGLPISQYPLALLKLDERNSNAYTMALKIAEHYNIDTNQITGTAGLLKVETLLKNTSLPSVDSYSVKQNGWGNRIKEPFETALETLVTCGFLVSYEYCKTKGEAMTDEEAENIATYKQWANTIIRFTLNNPPDHTKRIQTNQTKTTKKRKSKS